MSHLYEEMAVRREGSLFDLFPRIHDRWYSGRVGNSKVQKFIGKFQKGWSCCQFKGFERGGEEKEGQQPSRYEATWSLPH